MARYSCPSCGSAFDGKKCRNCLYEQFEGACPPGEHTHASPRSHSQMPPAVELPSRKAFSAPAAPARRTVPQTQKRTAKTKKKTPIWLIWLLVALFLEPVLDIGVEIFDSFDSVLETSTSVSTVARPENTQQLLSIDGFTLYVGEPNGTRYPLYLENATDQEVQFSSRIMVVDDFLSEQSYAYCNAPAGGTGDGSLWLDEMDLSYACIGTPGQVTISYTIYETEDYQDLVEGTFSMDLGGKAMPADPGGEKLLETAGVQVRYLGYMEDEYTPEEFCEGHLLFYVENSTDYELSIFSEQDTIDDREGPGFWCVIPPNTRTVTTVYLYGMDQEDVESIGPDSILEMSLIAGADDETYGYTELGSFTVKLA